MVPFRGRLGVLGQHRCDPLGFSLRIVRERVCSDYLLLYHNIAPIFSGIKQLFCFADRFCGLGIQTGQSGCGLSLLYNFWGLYWEDLNNCRLESCRGFLNFTVWCLYWGGSREKLSRDCQSEHLHLPSLCGLGFSQLAHLGLIELVKQKLRDARQVFQLQKLHSSSLLPGSIIEAVTSLPDKESSTQVPPACVLKPPESQLYLASPCDSIASIKKGCSQKSSKILSSGGKLPRSSNLTSLVASWIALGHMVWASLAGRDTRKVSTQQRERIARIAIKHIMMYPLGLAMPLLKQSQTSVKKKRKGRGQGMAVCWVSHNALSDAKCLL